MRKQTYTVCYAPADVLDRKLSPYYAIVSDPRTDFIRDEETGKVSVFVPLNEAEEEFEENRYDSGVIVLLDETNQRIVKARLYDRYSIDCTTDNGFRLLRKRERKVTEFSITSAIATILLLAGIGLVVLGLVYGSKPTTVFGIGIAFLSVLLIDALWSMYKELTKLEYEVRLCLGE